MIGDLMGVAADTVATKEAKRCRDKRYGEQASGRTSSTVDGEKLWSRVEMLENDSQRNKIRASNVGTTRCQT